MNIYIFSKTFSNLISYNRLVFNTEAGPADKVASKKETGAVEKVAAEKEKISPEKEDISALSSNPEAYFAKYEDKINQMAHKLGGKGNERFVQESLSRIRSLKEEYMESRADVERKYSAEKDTYERVNSLVERVQLRVEVRERIDKNPSLKRFYEKMNAPGGAADEFIIKVDDIFKKEKDPEAAIHKVMADMMKDRLLNTDMYKEPANPNELISSNNRLGKEQMDDICEMIGIDFESLNFTTEQLVKIDLIQSISYKCEGMTYLETGLLDANGKVSKEGLNRYFEYRDLQKEVDRKNEYMEQESEHMRSMFGASSFIMEGLKEYGGIKDKDGGLPTIAYGGRSFDLNEIAKDYNREVSKFSTIYEGGPSLENMSQEERAKELPQTLKALFDYSFDENSGALRGFEYGQLPDNIKSRLSSLGMEKVKVSGYHEKIRELDFEYRGKKMEISIGRNGYGDDKQPYLKGYLGNRPISQKPIDLNNIGNELESMDKELTAKEPYAKQALESFFPDESLDSSYWSDLSNRSVLDLKEMLLGSVSAPDATDLKGVSGKKLEQVRKILPLIIANQSSFGIKDEMTALEALTKIQSAPNAKGILSKDYSSVLAELKRPNASHYSGVKPRYEYVTSEYDRDKAVKESRDNSNPEYLARKEKLAKMEIGDKLEVEFKGKKYSFTLSDSFQKHEYRFKLDGYDVHPFEINNVDLVNKTPEGQLQYMMGTFFTKMIMEMDEAIRGLRSFKELGDEMSIQREYPADKLPLSLFKNIGLNYSQLNLLKTINEKQRLNIELSKNRYGKIDNFKIKWRDEQSKTNYYLDSVSGNYWRMSSLKDKSSKKEFLSYDIKTDNLPAKIKSVTSL